MGIGVEKDSNEAAKWYRSAADQGDADSATRLGMMLYKGDGIGQDLQEAIKLWTVAADQGNTYAQLFLADAYRTGTGVPRDLDKAHALFMLAGKTVDVTKQMKELSSQTDGTKAVKLR